MIKLGESRLTKAHCMDPWLDAEAVFTDLSELREKHPGELDGDPLAY